MSEKLEAGAILEGKVIKIKPFGAIIALPNQTQGLVHISHISSSFVKNVNEHLVVGDIVKVKVLSADAETNKISLSIKEVGDLPKKQEEQVVEYRPKPPVDANSSFEEKFKDWLKTSNERQAGLNKRNKRR